MSLIDPNHPTRRVRRALGLKTILGSDYPGEPFPDLPEDLRPFLPETGCIGIYPPELQSGPEPSSRNEPARRDGTFRRTKKAVPETIGR